MKKKSFLAVLMLIAVVVASLITPTPSLAAPTNEFQFTSVSPTSCVPGAFVGLHFLYSVAPGENPRTDNWTLTNRRTGDSTHNSAGASAGASGQGFLAGSWGMNIPANTQANDTIDIVVSMVSTVGQDATSRAAFNCTTGALVALAAASTGGGGVLFTDGRVNNKAEDAAQSVAIYCASDGGVVAYVVINSVGQKAFTATKAEIDAVPLNPDVNTLIKKQNGIALYRLHGGKLQINAPKYHTHMGKTVVDPSGEYVFIWDGC